MPIVLSFARWTRDVAVTQWNRDDGALAGIGAALPEVIAAERALAEVHRLDLSLFVVFEEVALRVSGALARSAPSRDALTFAAQQTLDEARHHEMFRARFECSRSRWRPPERRAGGDEIVIPPLMRRKFIDLCYEVADRGAFVDGLVLTNLVLEGMAYPLYGYEERYWKPVDPYLGRLIASAFSDETRHVAFGAALVGAALDDDRQARARVQRLTDRRASRDGRSLRLLRQEVRRPVRRGRAPPSSAVRGRRAGAGPAPGRHALQRTDREHSPPDRHGARPSAGARGTGPMRWLTRAEYLALMAVSGLLMLLHAREVSWLHATFAFAAIDLIGYLPGARAFRRAGNQPIPRIYHHLYNVTHNFLTAAVVSAVWALAAGRLEWAMLALPLHLAGDRGIFGNGFKPVAFPFEGHPAVEAVR